MTLPWLPDFVAVDIETSGLAAQEDDLLELAGVKFVAGEPVDRFTTTLQTERGIGRRTSQLTGLTDVALAEGMTVEHALKGLDQFAGSFPLVAHNVRLDKEFLERYSIGLAGVDFTENTWWDSLELAALVFPELDSLALEHVATRLGIVVGVTHRAEADAELAGRVIAGLFQHLTTTWRPEVLRALRDRYLVGYPLGELFRAMPIPEGGTPHAHTPLGVVDTQPWVPMVATESRRPVTIHLHRVESDGDAITHLQQDAGNEGRTLLLYPSLVYPGQFHGPEKGLAQRCAEAGIPCLPGKRALLSRPKLALLLAGGLPLPSPLSPYELGLLYAWAETSPTGDFTQLSWWVLNNFPRLAQALSQIASDGCGGSELPADDTVARVVAELQEAPLAAVPWGCALHAAHPYVPDQRPEEATPRYALLRPAYWPLQALRASQCSIPISAMEHQIAWLEEICGDGTGLPGWPAKGATLRAGLAAITPTLEAFVLNPGAPRCTTRGEEAYWPLLSGMGDGVGLVTAVRESSLEALAALAREATTLLVAWGDRSPWEARVALGTLQRQSAIAGWMLAHPDEITIVVQRQGEGKDHPHWWSLECFPRISRDLGALLDQTTRPVNLYSTHLDGADWALVQRVWRAEPAEAAEFTDHAAPLRPGNTVHLPLLPPGIRSLPPKKTWQQWQTTILRRLMQSGEGRWLIVARNPQDVATLQYRLREPMVRAGWQPLFQRHDGTKGFLMREFGGFEKVVMVGTGEVLQELDRFETPPDTLVLLHVPTRPPNDIVCVALQEQMGLTQEEYRDQVFFPLGVLDLKRALHNWPRMRDGAATVYLLDYPQLEHRDLRQLINQSFTTQSLLETQPASRY